MIQLLKNTEVNKTLWNTCIVNSNIALPYAYTWVLDIVHPNWQALVLDNYQAIMPLVYEKKMGFFLLRQSPWLQQLGIFSQKKLQEKEYQAFFKAIPQRFRKIYCRVNYQNSHFEQPKYFSVKERINLILPLSTSYDELKRNFSKNTIRNIKKAEKLNLQIEKKVSLPEIIDIYHTFQAPKHQFLLPKDYELLTNLLHHILAKENGFIWGVKNKENELIAANFFWQNKNRIISLLPSSTQKGRNTRAMFFLLNEVIKSNASSAKILDFEGSNQDNIARFNKGFGAIPQNYFELEKKRFPFWV